MAQRASKPLVVPYNYLPLFPLHVLSSVSIYHTSFCHYVILVASMVSQYHLHSPLINSPWFYLFDTMMVVIKLDQLKSNMVLILDGSSEYVVHTWSEWGNLICWRQLFKSTGTLTLKLSEERPNCLHPCATRLFSYTDPDPFSSFFPNTDPDMDPDMDPTTPPWSGRICNPGFNDLIFIS